MEADARGASPKADPHLTDKIHDGGVWADQGVIAGCAGGLFDNITEAADILRGTLPAPGPSASMCTPPGAGSLELMKLGATADLLESGAIIKPSFCGPCFGAGDVPRQQRPVSAAHHPELPQPGGQQARRGAVAGVCLMDARSIAATAANGGRITAGHGPGLHPRTPRVSLR